MFRCAQKSFLYLAFISVICITQSIYATYISRDRLPFYIDQQADIILRNHGYSAGGLPLQFVAEYGDCKALAKHEIESILSNNWRIFTDESEIKKVLELKLAKLITTLNSLIFVHEIDERVTRKINEFLSQHGYSERSIPKDHLTTFYAKKYSIIEQLRERMQRDARCYIRSSEVDQLVSSAYAEFISGIYMQSPLSNWFHDIANYWNTPSTPQTPLAPEQPILPQTTSTYVHVSYLENAVITAAQKNLTQHNIDPNNIPARAVSSYSEHIQKSIARAKKFADAAWDNKIAQSKIEDIVQEELKPVIDNITLQSEQCAICQDGYKKGQTVGYLACGHLFHDDCLHTSLSYKQQCPLCRAVATIVTKKEIVP